MHLTAVLDNPRLPRQRIGSAWFLARDPFPPPVRDLWLAGSVCLAKSIVDAALRLHFMQQESPH